MKKEQAAATGKAAVDWAHIFNIKTDAELAEYRQKFCSMILRGIDYLELMALRPDEIANAKEENKRAWEKAKPFVQGKLLFDKEILDYIGVETLYALLSEMYFRYAQQLEYRVAFSVEDHKDLLAILTARKQYHNLHVCGEGVDVAKKIWELQTKHFDLEEKGQEEEAEKLKQKIAEYEERLRGLGEEVYETLKRGERRAEDEGAFTRDRFDDAKRTLLAYGTPDIKQKQRERAAQWLIAENEAGHKASITDAAMQFGNEIENEKAQGGYSTTESLATALNKQADKLGIAQFIDKSGKRGRPRHG